MPGHRAPSEGTLSVCMIVKNEADFLARCLKSIQPVADQIVVVDTGSDDGTREVATTFGATLIEVQWRDDFAWARNISLDHASSAWILWLDADDVVPHESLAKIEALKRSIPNRVYGLIVRNQRPNNTGTEFVQARMFPNRPDIRFERKVHEQMMPSALRLGMTMEKTDVVVEHHGYADPETLKHKSRRNIGLMLQEYDSAHPDPVTAVEIADSFQLIDELTDAEKWYRTVLAMPGVETGFPAIVSQARTGLGNLYNRRELFDQAITELEAAVRLAPWRTDALYALAVAYELSGNLDKAIECLKNIEQVRPAPGQVGVDFRAAAIKAGLRLIRIFTDLNRQSDSINKAEQMLRDYPERPEIACMAGKAFLVKGDLIRALRLFEKSIALSKDWPHIDSYIGLWLIYQKAGKIEVMEKSIASVTPLFKDVLRYWAAGSRLTEGRLVAPEQFKRQDLDAEFKALDREFFRMIPD
jgi:tetratricopeptide (TPR) repeat protein